MVAADPNIIVKQMINWNLLSNIIPMSKNQTVTNPSNLFSLSPQTVDSYYQNVEVDFTPPLSLSSSSNSIIPTFFKDCKFYTPSFVLPRDRHYYRTTSEFEKHKFQELILKARSERSENLNDRRSTDLKPTQPVSKFCQICKKSFTEYNEHINYFEHLSNIRACSANRYIRDLTKAVNKRFKKTANPSKKVRKTKGHKAPISKKGKTVKKRVGKIKDTDLPITNPPKSFTNSIQA